MSTVFTTDFNASDFTAVEVLGVLAKRTGDSTAGAYISGNAATCITTRVAYYSVATPDSADQRVHFDGSVGSFDTITGHSVFAAARMDTSANTQIEGGWNAGAWEIAETIAGTRTVLATLSHDLRGEAFAFDLDVQGTSVNFYLNGSGTPTLSGTATISAAGSVGFVMEGSSENIDNGSATTYSSLTVTGTLSQTLDDATLSATGAIVGGVTGSVSQTLGDATLSATGTIVGTGATITFASNELLAYPSTGTALANQTGLVVAVDALDGSRLPTLVHTFTGVTTDSTGKPQNLTHASLSAGSYELRFLGSDQNPTYRGQCTKVAA